MLHKIPQSNPLPFHRDRKGFFQFDVAAGRGRGAFFLGRPAAGCIRVPAGRPPRPLCCDGGKSRCTGLEWRGKHRGEHPRCAHLGTGAHSRDSLTNKRDFCPPPCAMYVPCCSIRAVSTAQATPDQHPEQTQIEQRPDFGNIAKRQTHPSPTQSTFSVDGALPGRRCAILAGSMHSPRLAGQIGGARTEQGRGGGDVRSGRLREPTSTGRAWTTARSAGGVARPGQCVPELAPS